MTSRLRRLAQRGGSSKPAFTERLDRSEQCELCAVSIPESHPHLLERSSGLLRCACRACAVVLDRSAAIGGRYRLVPDRYLELSDLAADDAHWAALGIPVSLAFLVRPEAGEPRAVFPGALGPTDAVLDREAWAALESAYPAVLGMERDVEAVLVNRVRGARECWIVPIEACYRLVALVRTRWQGINGGDEVWQDIERFFAAFPKDGASAIGRNFHAEQQAEQPQHREAAHQHHEAGAYAGRGGGELAG
jgi:hypothetical protein